MKTTKTAFNAILLFCAVLLCSGAASAQQTNFSGKWLVNIAKSSFGSVPAYAAVKQFTIIQDGQSMHISRVIVNEKNEEKTSIEDDLIDGQPHPIKINEQMSKVNTITWSEDQHVLTTVSKYEPVDQPDKGYTLTQTWKLLDTNTMEVDLTSPAYTIKVIYDKRAPVNGD